MDRTADAKVRERFNLVVVGHVDHGKSTLIGRLLADTGALPDGKLAQVKASCARNSKPFEYAFLLDALENEQSQGITIDTARCFFKSPRRDYIIIDAPGHIEFLKNMISGAARGEAALLVIDAKEGVRENSRRHGYMLSMLGIRQIAVIVNKMDLVGYDEEVYRSIVVEYSDFLRRIDVEPSAFVPVSAYHGENLIAPSQLLPWYSGPSLLGVVDQFTREPSRERKPFRFPVQDVYKFTEFGDERRIIAGRVESGSIEEGAEVTFLPSGKRARIRGIEEFNAKRRSSVQAGRSIGFTIEPELYVKPGEVMVKTGESPPEIAEELRVNLFWMGRNPMVRGKRYKLKVAATETEVRLKRVSSVLDASNLGVQQEKDRVDLHDVADCVLESVRPIAFDLSAEIAATGRFVVVDEYQISGGGIILEAAGTAGAQVVEQIKRREIGWVRTGIPSGAREGRYAHRAAFVIVTGQPESPLEELARCVERRLFERGRFVYYLGLSNSLLETHSDAGIEGGRPDFLRRLGEIAHLFTDAGTILITTVPDLDSHELDLLSALSMPNEVIGVGLGSTGLPAGSLRLELPVPDGAESGAVAVEELLLASTLPVAAGGPG